MRNWFFRSSADSSNCCWDLYGIGERQESTLIHLYTHQIPLPIAVNSFTLSFKVLTSYIRVPSWLNAPTSIGFNQTEHRAKYQLYSFSQPTPHFVISSGADAFHWRDSAPSVHSHYWQELALPLLSLSQTFIELWSLVIQCMKDHQRLGIVLSIIHLQSMVGLFYIINFFSLSPSPLLPFFSCALR